MGLNFKNSTVQWSYGGFHDFRTRLAAEIGVTLDEMEGFGGSKSWRKIHDDIVPFLFHSDCEGSITSPTLNRIAPRLRELVKGWPDGFDKDNAIKLSADMLRLAKAGKRLQFC